MTQDINGFPNPALLTEGAGNCVLLAPLTSSSSLGGGGAIGSGTQAHFVSANPAIGNFNFDGTLGMTQGASAQAIQYSMTDTGLQGSFANFTISFTIDKTFYTSTSDHYLFSGTGGNAISYAVLGSFGKHMYQESGVDSTILNPNIYTYQENKPAQIQHVIAGDATRYHSYIDGLEILSGPRVFTSAAWASFYAGSLTVLTNGITTNHMKDFALQNRTISLTPRRIKSVGYVGHSFDALSSVPQELYRSSNYIPWMPRGKSGGIGYTVGDVLTPVGTANGGGTGGTITVASVDINGAIVVCTCTGGIGYIAGSIITAVTGGTGVGARFQVAGVLAGALTAVAVPNPFGATGTTGNGYAVSNVLTPAGTALYGGVSAGSGTGGTITVATIDGSGNILTATATGGSGYSVGQVISAVTGGAGTGARFQVTGVSGGALTSVVPLFGGGGLFSSNGYGMFASDATALTVYSRGDTSYICQSLRQLFKNNQYPVNNGHRSEAGAYLAQIIGTTALTGRAYLCGFEALKIADNIYPDQLNINAGANEAAEALSGGTNYNAFDARYKVLLTDAASASVQLCVLNEVLSLANSPTYAGANQATYEARVVALNAIINALPAWARSQGMTMQVVVNRCYSLFGGASPTAGLFRPNDIHPNAFGSSLLGYSEGQTAVAALSASSFVGKPVFFPGRGVGIPLQ